LLSEYGLDGQLLSTELIDEQLVPMARKRIGQNRLQTLATMVLLGMNRVVVRDGTISARIQIRAQANDKAKVDYAVSSDPGGPTWGERGSAMGQPGLMVSTVAANVQTDTQLKAELFGEVRINFASETLPLERFADPARMTLLQRNSRAGTPANAAPAAAVPAALPAAVPAPAAAVPAAPAAAAPVPVPPPGTMKATAGAAAPPGPGR